MAPKGRLSKSMTLAEFETGYWYAAELKDFAVTLGIPGANKLRKDEIEKAITAFITDGKLRTPTKRALTKTGVKDLDIGLRADLPVAHYTSNKVTKGFIIDLARKQDPGFKPRPGVWYRLNRWSEEQLTASKPLTYGDLAGQLHKLSQPGTEFKRVAHGRYINFITDFMKHEKNARHAKAVAAWNLLKELPVAKDYASWLKASKRKKGK
jgi:hypothetical protein